ncbi:hypothetical protein BH20ACT5_BH20ACT5_01670 [soil metagenome]
MTPALSGGLALAPEQFEAAPTGLFVILLLGVGVFFLGRSMIKHIRKVPDSFDPPEDPSPDRPDDPSVR